MSKKLTTEDIVKRFNEINGDKYDYSEFVYVNAHTKGKIICPKHGEFWQSSNVHLKGVQCPKCAKENVKRGYFKLTKEIFLDKANEIHNNKYEYDLTNFENSKSIIRIKCPIHGWFEQHVIRHMHGQGCPTCGNDAKREKMSITLDEFIIRANIKHNNKFNYELVEFKNNKDYIKIICPIHGIFEQRVDEHLKGRGCAKCVGRNKTKEEFIEEAIKVHGDRYDYSLVEYTTAETKIKIKCNKCGFIFEQKPWSHLQNHGCPHCKFSKGELLIEKTLIENNIDFEPQKRFDWLGTQTLDFYLPKYNIGIEVQGEHHFSNEKCFGKKEIYDITVERDKKKYNLCNENNVKILYFSILKENPTEYFDKIYTNTEELVRTILN